MNFQNIGIDIAKVINTNNKTEKILSVEDDVKKVGEDNYFKEYKCKEGEYIQQIPSKNRDRSCLYVTGMSDSGKTTYSKKYIDQYKKMFKKREVYVFSYFKEDKSLGNKVNRINLDKLADTPLELEDMANSLVLFDDIDTIRQKALRNRLKGILHCLLELGRHYNIEVIYISHQANKSAETKCILNEAVSITIFPKVMSSKNFKYLLENYYGLNKKQMIRIKSLPSRWVTITKTYPNILLYLGGAYVLEADL
jgi:uncharacterized protein YerC